MSGKPVVAILDGVPFVNHSILENRLILDDLMVWKCLSGKRRGHGTVMASLVCHGEIGCKGRISATTSIL